MTWVRSHVPVEQQIQIASQLQPTREFRQTLALLIQQTFEKQRNIELEKVGLTCLSAKNDDSLMWGHYANGHRGLCLEFDTSKEPFTHARPVTYSSTVPLFSSIKVLEGNVDDIVEALILTKHSSWSYENEWRIPHNAPSTAVKYEDFCFNRSLLRSEDAEVHREIVSLLLDDASTKLYSMSIVPGSFTLTSHVIDPRSSSVSESPNTACTGQVGVCAIFKRFSGFEFILLPGRVHARPPASNANRWVAGA